MLGCHGMQIIELLELWNDMGKIHWLETTDAPRFVLASDFHCLDRQYPKVEIEA